MNCSMCGGRTVQRLGVTNLMDKCGKCTKLVRARISYEAAIDDGKNKQAQLQKTEAKIAERIALKTKES